MNDLNSTVLLFQRLSVKPKSAPTRTRALQSLNCLLDKVATLSHGKKKINDALLLEIQQNIQSLLLGHNDLKKLQAHNLKICIAEVLKSSHPEIKASKHKMVAHLHSLNYFRTVGALNYLSAELARHGNSEAFRCLLDHKNIIPNSRLDTTSHYFLEESLSSIYNLDLFYKLNPDEYKHKNWSQLTSYVKLYHIVWEKYSILELSHRLGLKGQACVQWQGKSLTTQGVKPDIGMDSGDSAQILNLDGQIDGHSFVQLRDNLQSFRTQHHDESGILKDVIDAIFAVPPMKHHRFKYRLKNKQSELFLLGLDDYHFAAAYLSNRGIYYEINLGFRPDDILDAGVSMHAVPKDSMVDVHARLCSLQYCGTTKAFHKIAYDLNLELLASFILPGQVASNCTYENSRALVFVLAFDKLFQSLPMKESYLQAVQLYRQFCLFDVRNAPVKYCINSLSPNKSLLNRVEGRLEQAEESIFKRNNYQALIFSTERSHAAIDEKMVTPSLPVKSNILEGP